MFGKRLICFFLCLTLITVFFGCGQQPSADIPATESTPIGQTVPESTAPIQTEPESTEPEPTEPSDVPRSYYDDEKGAWILLDRFGLELLREHPTEQFIVAAEIDCKGMVWEPIADFSGSVSGLWGGKYNHTISNLTITGTENVGFFSILSGSVKDLDFADITVTLPDAYNSNCGFLAANCTGTAEDIAGHRIQMDVSLDGGCVGTMFGTVSGSITDCYVDGTLTAQLSGNEDSIGGLAGSLETGVTALEARTNLNLTAAQGSSYIGGVAGQLLQNATNISYGGYLNTTGSEQAYVGTLAGTLSGTISQSYSNAKGFYWNDSARETVFCGITGDTGSVSDCYIRDISSLDELLPAAEYELRKTAVDYMYAQCTIPWTPSKTFPEYDAEHTDGYKEGVTYFGLPYSNDCCGSMERFASYLDENGILSDEISTNRWDFEIGNDCADAVYWAWSQVSPSVTFTLTRNMICMNGTVQVGDYVLANKSLTKNTTDANTPQTMYEAYGQVHMGDAVLWAPGHVRMAAEAAYVYRDSAGNILPDISYILVHEQGASWSTDKHWSTCAVNNKFTFTQLLEKTYIPITIPEFAEGKAGTPVASCDNPAQTADAMFMGTLSSNYRINWARMEISEDATGKVLANSTLYTSGGNHNDTFSLSRFSKTIDVSKLEAGITYRYKVLVGVANSQEILVKDYTFTL